MAFTSVLAMVASRATLKVREMLYSRPAEPGQSAFGGEASLAWWRATVSAKRRQRDQTLCD
jgi:hypothetical protein